jgi:putative oxidoreductase
MDDETIEPKRLLIPGLAGLYQFGSKYSYAFMRFCTGMILLPHGVVKLMAWSPGNYATSIASHGIPGAAILATLMILTESFGALFLAVGLFTRFCAVAIAIEMAVIVTQFQWQFGYFWTSKGYEFALLWVLLCIGIFFRGGGRYSIDRLLGREL